MDTVPAAEIFPHMRVLLGTVIGLGIARLLLTVAGMVQHPHRARISPLHLLWVGSLLLEMVLFWWWEFALFRLAQWNFGIALFMFAYAILLFLLAALLSPDNLDDYAGYEDFFLKRRRWFFGTFALIAVFDVIDTLIKNGVGQGSQEYLISGPAGLIVCFIAWRTSSPRTHLIIVLVHLLYQATMVARFFNGT